MLIVTLLRSHCHLHIACRKDHPSQTASSWRTCSFKPGAARRVEPILQLSCTEYLGHTSAACCSAPWRGSLPGMWRS
jgi:hypothetical protein